MSKVFDVLTNQTYDLSHLRPFEAVYTVRVNETPTEVPLFVTFSDHCYTDSRKADHPDEAVISRVKKRNGYIEERVFCRDRWNVSLSLPHIIAGLHDKRCLLGDSEVFYRQEGVPKHNDHAGWYICLRLGVSEKHQNLTLGVRSTHWRTNRPFDLRGHPRPFYVILSDFYTRQKATRGWLK